MYDILLDDSDPVLQFFAGFDVSVGAQLVFQEDDLAFEAGLFDWFVPEQAACRVFAAVFAP